MKKILFVVLSSFLVFTACAKSDTNKKTDSEVKEKTETKNEVVDYEGYEITSDHIYKSVSPEELDGLLSSEGKMYVFFGRSS